MSTDNLQRGVRAKKEAYILSIVQSEGKIRTTQLYGVFSRHFPGSAIRTFLNEYLQALEYRGDVVLHVGANGYFVYSPSAFEQEEKGVKSE